MGSMPCAFRWRWREKFCSSVYTGKSRRMPARLACLPVRLAHL